MTERPLRADARRNREKLLTAAAEVFAAAGEDATLEAVAARAGVGIGTLYRNFPDREALLVAAYQREVDALCLAVTDLLESKPPDEVLLEWAERFAAYAATKRGMGSALQTALASDLPLHAETRERILAGFRQILDAGAAAGTLRSDIDAEDVMRVISAIWYVPAGPAWRETVRNMLRLVVDGLRYGTDEE